MIVSNFREKKILKKEILTIVICEVSPSSIESPDPYNYAYMCGEIGSLSSRQVILVTQ